MTESPIVIAGAGLAGSLMAVYLARRGHEVVVFERRADLRTTRGTAGRSINLALSERGLAALAAANLAEQVLEFAVPMNGRMMHAVDRTLTYQPYGRTGEAINSVSRRALNALLMNAAEEAGARIEFETRVRDLDLQDGTVVIEDPLTRERWELPARLVIGADGVFSKVRARMQRRGRFDYSQTYLEHGYKELTMPPAGHGGYRLEPNALHIWPRRDFMLIALPNPDCTFTCTLFLRHDGDEASFEALQTHDQLIGFFERHFPDAREQLPDLTTEFFGNPTGDLAFVRCDPFHHGARAVLVGDAAHAVVPFYGQGMNAAFEDCLILDGLIESYGFGDLETALSTYTRRRKPNADAISELALDNFEVMRDRVADERFLARTELEHLLERAFPETFRSLYGMISFSNLPYADARAIADAQTAWLDDVEAAGGDEIAGLLALGWVRHLASL